MTHTTSKIAMASLVLALLLCGGALYGAEASDAEDAAPADTCTIIYIVDSTAYTVSGVAIADGSAALADVLPTGAEAPVGQTLAGWMYSGSIVDAVAATAGQTYTVTAVFSPAVYTVTLVCGDATVTASYGYGDTVALPTLPTAPEGYELAGWTDGTATYKTIPTVTGSAIYAAVYTAVEPAPIVVPTYTVSYVIGEDIIAVTGVKDVSVYTAPAIAGYTVVKTVTDGGNIIYTYTAVPAPAPAEQQILGLDVVTFAVIVVLILAITAGMGYWAYRSGILRTDKSVPEAPAAEEEKKV